MTEQTALAIRPMSLSDTLTLGQTLAQSGYFSDAKQAAQAVVKIMAGAELGFGPIAAMTGIHIIQGKPSIGANLMAAAIKSDPRYDYRVVVMTDDEVEIVFFERGKEVGRSSFTMDQARAINYYDNKAKSWKSLTEKHNWRSYPRNMLFARALSNGLRWYCPDATGGAAVYTPEELGAEVDGDGNVIDVTPTVVKDPEPTTTNEDATQHWIEDQKVRPRFWAWTKELTLTSDQVHVALGCEHVYDYPGTMGEAKAQIEGWIKTNSDDAAKTQEAIDDLFLS